MSPIPWREPKPWLKAALSLATGCGIFLATADFDVWPLAWFAFLPLFWAIRTSQPRRAFLWGWLTGWITNFGGFYWIPHLLIRFGHLPVWLSWLLFALLAAAQGIHFGVFAWALTRTRDRFPTLPMTLLAPLFFVSAELLTPMIFPWYLAITQAWIPATIQIADIFGVLGVTAILMVANGMLYDIAEWRLLQRTLPRRALLTGAGLIVATFAYGQVRIHQVEATRASAKKIKVGVVQANLGIKQKGHRNLALDHLRLHLDVSRKLQAAGAELIVWPESSYPFAIERSRTTDFPPQDPRRVMQGLNVPLLFGALTYTRGSPHPYNSALLMTPQGKIAARFDKNYLMLFGEYIPFYDKVPSFKKWFPAASHFARGTEPTVFPLGDHRIGPLVCYEDIIPSFTRRLAALRPNLMINITNDAWFGTTAEPHQHMALSVYRAIELRLDLVRAVNTGVSTIIDATGRVRVETKAHDPVIEGVVPPDTILHPVAMMPGGPTIYTLVGDLFANLCLLGSLGLLFILPLWRHPILPLWRRRKPQMATPYSSSVAPPQASEKRSSQDPSLNGLDRHAAPLAQGVKSANSQGYEGPYFALLRPRRSAFSRGCCCQNLGACAPRHSPNPPTRVGTPCLVGTSGHQRLCATHDPRG